MSISRKTLLLPSFAFVAAFVPPSLSLADETPLNECARQWVAATANPKFFQPWPEYYTECKKKLDEEAAAKAAAPAAAPEPEAKTVEAPPPKPTPAPPAAAPAPAPAAATPPAPKAAKPVHKPAKKPGQH